MPKWSYSYQAGKNDIKLWNTLKENHSAATCNRGANHIYRSAKHNNRSVKKVHVEKSTNNDNPGQLHLQIKQLVLLGLPMAI